MVRFVDYLLRQGFLVDAGREAEWPEGTVTVQYSFQHALYQHVLYKQAGQAQRVRLHRQARCTSRKRRSVWTATRRAVAAF